MFDLPAIRRDLHAHPELSGQESRTAGIIAEILQQLGLETQTGIGGYGVIGMLRGGAPGKTLALRADMDALPIREDSPLSYRSVNNDVMHACGHDGHTAVLLGVAEALAQQREALRGAVRFLFQPAEEIGQGAKGMIAAGALEGVDAIAALHAWPPLAVGEIGIRRGAMTASADTLDIVITGKGGHGGYPHMAVDPIITAAQLIMALQTIASREVDPSQPVVVSITQVQAGTASNIIPETARLVGTLRAHSPDVRAALPEQIRRICEGICAASRCTCEVIVSDGNPPVVNDPTLTKLLIESAAAALGDKNVKILPNASMGAEDFAEYLGVVPGVFFRLGIGRPAPLHTPTFDFNDDALPVGVAVMTDFARRFLM